MGMNAIQKLEMIMKKIGGRLEDTGYNLHLDAPNGYIWKSNGLPTFTLQYANNSQTWLSKILQVELKNLKMGLQKVTDPEQIKQIQYDLDDDTWGADKNSPIFIPFGNS